MEDLYASCATDLLSVVSFIQSWQYMNEASDSRSSVDYIPWRSLPLHDILSANGLSTLINYTCISYHGLLSHWHELSTVDLYLTTVTALIPGWIHHVPWIINCHLCPEGSIVVCPWIICCPLHCNQGELLIRDLHLHQVRGIRFTFQTTTCTHAASRRYMLKCFIMYTHQDTL